MLWGSDREVQYRIKMQLRKVTLEEMVSVVGVRTALSISTKVTSLRSRFAGGGSWMTTPVTSANHTISHLNNVENKHGIPFPVKVTADNVKDVIDERSKISISSLRIITSPLNAPWMVIARVGLSELPCTR